MHDSDVFSKMFKMVASLNPQQHPMATDAQHIVRLSQLREDSSHSEQPRDLANHDDVFYSKKC